MSEWKWCGECGHHFDTHVLMDKGDVWRGRCLFENCDCPRFDVQDLP